MPEYRVRVRQELEYKVIADNEDEVWELVDGDDFGDPDDAVWSDFPDILDVSEIKE